MKNIINIFLLTIYSGFGFCQDDSANDLDQLIKKGDSLITVKNYSWALQVYEEAGKIKLTDSLQVKIKNTQNLLTKENGCDAPETLYAKIVSKADEYFNQKEFEKSKEIYDRALLIRPNDRNVINRIKEIEQIENDINKK